MTQRDRDRLVVLKKAQKKLITQEQAAGGTGRHAAAGAAAAGAAAARTGDKSGHSRAARPAVEPEDQRRRPREKVVRILSGEVYRGFGPTLASEYLAKKHEIGDRSRGVAATDDDGGPVAQPEAEGRSRTRMAGAAQFARRELVQWDTSIHDWLEGRGETMYLIHMIDDATSELTGDASSGTIPPRRTCGCCGSIWNGNGRPLAFYTDKASLFRTAPKMPRDQKELARDEREPLPPTQIGRALRELGIVWIAAHSPQAKGRVERSFGTAQDRLVKGLRVAGATTLEEANRYLDDRVSAVVESASGGGARQSVDAHRPLEREHDLAAMLCEVETRQVTTTTRFGSRERSTGSSATRSQPGLRGAQRTDREAARWRGAVRFRRALSRYRRV